MKLEELIGSLRTFEMGMRSEKKARKKSIAFVAESGKQKVAPFSNAQEDLIETFARFSKKFGKAINRLKNKNGSDRKLQDTRNLNSSSSSSQETTEQYLSLKKEIQCRECHGFGHIQSECANTLKKLKKQNFSYTASHSDEETDESGSEYEEEQVALMVRQEDDTKEAATNDDPLQEGVESDEEDLDAKYLAESYELLHKKCIDILEVNKSLSIQLSEITKERDILKELSDSLKKDIFIHQQGMQIKLGELEHLQKMVKMMNGTQKLDQILETGQSSNNKTGLGYQKKWVPKKGPSPSPQFVRQQLKSSEKYEERIPVKHVPQFASQSNAHPRDVRRKEKEQKPRSVSHFVSRRSYYPEEHYERQSPRRVPQFVSWKQNSPPSQQMNNAHTFIPVCHYCDRPGHIRPRCRFLLRDRQRSSKNTFISHKCYVIHNSLWSEAQVNWYFDSGCSKHMTGNKSFLSNIQNVEGDRVTFGDGVQAKVIGVGTLNVPGLPNLKDVLLVDGLKANLISISQLCDGDLNVSIDKKRCLIYNGDKEYLVGHRSTDNSYVVTPNLKNFTAQSDITVEVYAEWPKELVDQKFPNYVYKMLKGLHSLKQTPNAWYKTLTEEMKIISEFMPTEWQLRDKFTEPLDADRFETLRERLRLWIL